MMRLLMKKLNKIHFNCSLAPVPFSSSTCFQHLRLLKQSKIKKEKKKKKQIQIIRHA